MKKQNKDQKDLLNAMEHSDNGEVQAIGVMGVIAARELVEQGVAEIISENVDQYGAGTINLRRRTAA
jgi:hypothetical protein